MNRRVSNALPSKFESLSVKNLNVEHLNVSKGHNLSGVSDIKVPEENLVHAEPVDDKFESLFNIVREFQMRLEKLESENLVLKDKLNNLNLEDLKNVDITVYEREDGAFLGWADDIKNWVPFREGGT
tara:strand:+ start:1958 stop:2338 length:381 start_codon:yes stop_codon:yes gene_type:complete